MRLLRARPSSSSPIPPLALSLLAAACGAAPQKPGVVRPPPRDAAMLLAPPDRSRWMPESLDGADLVETLPDGTRRALLGRLRVEASPTGAIRRARDLLPISRPAAAAQTLPARLGGGHLFVTSGSNAQVFRAPDFLGRLTMLARGTSGPVAVIPGPDRLLLRSLGQDRIEAIDVETGAFVAPLPLPLAPRVSALAFADARRGVVVADLLGVLSTLDAGASWQRLPVVEARSASLEDGALVVQGSAGRWLVDESGRAVAEGQPGDASRVIAVPPSKARPPRRPLGDRPLRAALDDGWPMPDGTAVVARAGKLARVRLDDGEVVGLATLAGEEDSACVAVRYGVDVGFACGAPGRGTSIHAFVPPLGAVPVARFATARAVAASGSGALVVRGPCGDGEAPSGVAAYCVLPREGAPREIHTRGDVGVERVVALADGRVVVVVPPRGGSDGQLTLLPATATGGAARVVPLVLPDDVSALRRGLWLDGVQEIESGELSAWVESGGSLVGVRVKVDDGTVVAGRVREESQAVVSGTLGLVVAAKERRAHETVDGGMTWTPVDLPDAGQGSPLRDPSVAGGLHCGRVGCAMPFDRGVWLRVGWGPRADPTDLEDAEERLGPTRGSSLRRTPTITCGIARVDAPREEDEAPARPTSSRRFDRGEPEQASASFRGFRGAPPPALPTGFAAFSEGTTGQGLARLYAWAPKGAAAGRAARYQVRFFDRFDTAPGVGVRSSSISLPPWHDEAAIAEALGAGVGTSVVFHALPDVSGRATLLAGCRGGGRDGCELFSVAEGRAVSQLPDSEDEPYGRLFPPTANAVWVEESWYVANVVGASLVVFRVEPTRSRVIARLPRGGSNPPLARLVRRAHGPGIGVLVRGQGVFGVSDEELYVLPLSADGGPPGELVRLGPTDFASRPITRCHPDDDGWLLETAQMGLPIGLRVQGARVTDAELRVRIDPGRLCVDTIAARLLDVTSPAPAAQPRKPALVAVAAPPAVPSGPDAIPLVASNAGGKRAIGACAPLRVRPTSPHVRPREVPCRPKWGNARAQIDSAPRQLSGIAVIRSSHDPRSAHASPWSCEAPSSWHGRLASRRVR